MTSSMHLSCLSFPTNTWSCYVCNKLSAYQPQLGFPPKTRSKRHGVSSVTNCLVFAHLQVPFSTQGSLQPATNIHFYMNELQESSSNKIKLLPLNLPLILVRDTIIWLSTSEDLSIINISITSNLQQVTTEYYISHQFCTFLPTTGDLESS